MSCKDLLYLDHEIFFVLFSASTTISTPTTTPAGKNSVYPLLRPSGVGGGGDLGGLYLLQAGLWVSQ